MTFKLGKKPARTDSTKLKLRDYITPTALPPLPAVFGHEDLIASWPMLANDRFSDCVFAGAAHETMLLVAEGGGAVTFTDAAVLADYAAVTGFVAGDPASDSGADMQEAASYRRKTGIGDARGNRHKIAAFLGLEPGDVTHLYLAAYLFGAVGIGLALPASALDQSTHGQSWDVVAGSPAEGGHYVPLIGRGADGLLRTVSWGAIQPMTEKFFTTYCDEAVAYVSAEFLINQKSPEGFDVDALIKDLAALQG